MPRMSQAQFNAYQARRNVKALPQMEDATDREADLHEQIFAECRRRGWIALHGAMSERTNRTLGEWDFTIVGNRRSEDHLNREHFAFVLFVELKTRTGKLSSAQSAMHAHAAKLGHQIHVVRSFREFLELI